MFPKYHKINSLYKRDERGQFTGEFSQPEFEYLYRDDWVLTEKVDGTNIRIGYDADTDASNIVIGGRTENSQIPATLIPKLDVIGKRLWESDIWYDGDENCNVTLYGEGYGARIQKGGGNYNPDGVDFVLFDVLIGDFWLQRPDVESVAAQLEIETVPVVATSSLEEAETFIEEGFSSAWGDFPAEGVVATPLVPLRTRRGDRIITKLKTKDYR
jgi:hypothetical protein